MTREERAREVLMEHLGHSSGLLPAIMAINIRQAMLAFADAEAAAMRERAAIAARDAMCDQEWPPTDGDRQIDEVLAAIRALPATGEVGCG